LASNLPVKEGCEHVDGEGQPAVLPLESICAASLRIATLGQSGDQPGIGHDFVAGAEVRIGRLPGRNAGDLVAGDEQRHHVAADDPVRGAESRGRLSDVAQGEIAGILRTG
jgi:hypothetical protein